MKKWRKRLSCALVLCCLAGALAACGGGDTPAETTAGQSQMEVAVNPSAASAEEPTSVQETDAVAGETQRVTQQLGDNLLIDADAVIPAKQQYSTYTLKMVDTDPDRLFAIFCPEGYEAYTAVNRSYVVYQESSGKSLVVYKTSSYFNLSYSAVDIDSAVVSDETKAASQEVGTLMYYHTVEYPQPTAHDLSFMTVTEMEEYGRNLFRQLGIAWEPELLRCTTLSGQEILDFQQEILKDDFWNAARTPTILTDAQDTCYLEFKFSYDGLPLMGPEEPLISLANSWNSPQTAEATLIINADGLQDCTVALPCVVESTSEPQTILSLEEAIEKLKEKYDLQILSSELKISEIWMEYIPMIRNESIVLEPYWCFKREADILGYSAGADRFNAITGKDLAYES